MRKFRTIKEQIVSFEDHTEDGFFLINKKGQWTSLLKTMYLLMIRVYLP